MKIRFRLSFDVAYWCVEYRVGLFGRWRFVEGSRSRSRSAAEAHKVHLEEGGTCL